MLGGKRCVVGVLIPRCSTLWRRKDLELPVLLTYTSRNCKMEMIFDDLCKLRRKQK